MTTNQEQIAITKYDLFYEARMTKMEILNEKLIENMKEIREDVREIRNDLKWLFGIMLGFSGILMAIMAKGFHWIG